MAFLVWVYSQRNWAWPTVRNVMLATYLVGLMGYIFYPTAPPRMFRERGFVDTLASTSLSHDSEGVSLLANPYAAMPSLHTATAILLAITAWFVMRHWVPRIIWLLYPALVVFSIIATGNHFILDAVAGAFALALAGTTVLLLQ